MSPIISRYLDDVRFIIDRLYSKVVALSDIRYLYLRFVFNRSKQFKFIEDYASFLETTSDAYACQSIIDGVDLSNDAPIKKNVANSILDALNDGKKASFGMEKWFDGDIFSGKPDWDKFFKAKSFELTEEEQTFVDGPVEKLCALLDDWKIQQDRELPPEAWDYIKKEKFFGLVIPKEYGGLGFSASGHSAVVTKIATRSIVVRNVVITYCNFSITKIAIIFYYVCVF